MKKARRQWEYELLEKTKPEKYKQVKIIGVN